MSLLSLVLPLVFAQTGTLTIVVSEDVAGFVGVAAADVTIDDGMGNIRISATNRKGIVTYRGIEDGVKVSFVIKADGYKDYYGNLTFDVRTSTAYVQVRKR